MKQYVLLFTILLCCLQLGGCNSVDCDEEPDNEECQNDDNVNIDTPAYPILEEQASLSSFSVQRFSENSDYNQEDMQLEFLNYSTAETNEKLTNREQEDTPWINDLTNTTSVWDEKAPRQWEKNETPFLISGSLYQKTKPYRLLVSGNLQATMTSEKNYSLFEAELEDIFEQQQGVQYIWDLGDIELEGIGRINDEINLENRFIRNYVTHPDSETLSLLPFANIWDENEKFSEGATVYTLTRRVTKNVLIIESVLQNNEFTLEPTRFTQTQDNLTDAISSWPISEDTENSLEILYSLGALQHEKIRMQFDPDAKEVEIFKDESANTITCTIEVARSNCQRWRIPYKVSNDEKFLEIDLQQLTYATLEDLSLSGEFNFIIAGPFDDEQNFYYGKHYIETAAGNVQKITPSFLFNPVARDDIQRVFRAWREERYDDSL